MAVRGSCSHLELSPVLHAPRFRHLVWVDKSARSLREASKVVVRIVQDEHSNVAMETGGGLPHRGCSG